MSFLEEIVQVAGHFAAGGGVDADRQPEHFDAEAVFREVEDAEESRPRQAAHLGLGGAENGVDEDVFVAAVVGAVADQVAVRTDAAAQLVAYGARRERVVDELVEGFEAEHLDILVSSARFEEVLERAC